VKAMTSHSYISTYKLLKRHCNEIRTVF